MREIGFRAWDSSSKTMRYFRLDDFFDVTFYTAGYDSEYKDWIFMQDTEY